MSLNCKKMAACVCVVCELNWNREPCGKTDSDSHNVSTPYKPKGQGQGYKGNGLTAEIPLVVLPCLHLICQNCLQSAKKEKATNAPGIFPCPGCGFIIQAQLHGRPNDGVHTDFKKIPNFFLNPVIADNISVDERNSRTFCMTCDCLVPPEEIDLGHREHDVIALNEMIKSKKEYIGTLLNRISDKISHTETAKRQMRKACDHLVKTKSELASEINSRSQKVIKMIHHRREELISELDAVCEEQMRWFATENETQSLNLNTFQHSYEFAEKVMTDGNDDDLLNFHNDISNRLLHLIHRVKEASLDLLNLKMDLPEPGKEESHLEKLFGTLTQGRILCGAAELLQKFNVGLKWPNSLVMTKSRDIVITGKEGTFDSQGRLLFYNRHGKLLKTHEYSDKCIPYDVTCAHNGTIYISDNTGCVSVFSQNGDKISVKEKMFQGTSGRLALTTSDHLLITSSQEECIWKYDSEGSKIGRIPEKSNETLPSLAHPHCLATNSNNDIIISDLQDHKVSVYNSTGCFKFCYSGGEAPEEDLKCPSCVCCDPFNNILISDFTNDTVHLISQSGKFLGHLLTKDNHVSCPNFVSLDHEGHLFIGQYGGDISVYRYLSCIKHA